MNLRNKWAVHSLRSLLGLLMLVMGAMGLYFVIAGNAPAVAGETDAIRAALKGLTVSGIMVVVKVFEIIIGLMLLFNFRPALATLLLAPLTVGILTYDLTLWMHMPAAAIPAFLLLVLNCYFGYVYWKKYAPLFAR